ncbi:MAG: hypothetical protein KJ077_11230 [Anaerolineae bacterium]|nr:hypothetical protein [Anaerolineae bacterium]
MKDFMQTYSGRRALPNGEMHPDQKKEFLASYEEMLRTGQKPDGAGMLTPPERQVISRQAAKWRKELGIGGVA